jgi:hypothetical protein
MNLRANVEPTSDFKVQIDVKEPPIHTGNIPYDPFRIVLIL